MDEMNLNTVDAVQESAVDSQIGQVETTVESVNADNVNVTNGRQEETKPVQSQEENAKFAEVRRRASEEARIKAKDEMIAEMYGESHGIKTYAEYQEALAKQKEEQKLSEMREQGIEPDLIRQYAEDLPEVKEAKQMKRDRESMRSLYEIAPEITDASQIPSEVLTAYFQGKDLASEYAVWKLKNDLKERTKAKANAENARGSMGSVSGDGVANGDDFVSYDTFEKNKLNQSWVNRNFDKIMKSRTKW